MTFTRKQKIYAAVCGVAAAVFVWDRSSPTEKPAAGDNGMLIHATATPHRAPGNTGGLAGGSHLSIGQRVSRAASLLGVDLENTDSAFALGQSWLPPKPAASTDAKRNSDPATPAPAKLFAQRHRLDAVMMHTKGGYAIVDGRGVFVGQRIDQFRLESLRDNTAVFVLNDQRAELRIIRPDELIRDGSVISNQTRTTPADGDKEASLDR